MQDVELEKRVDRLEQAMMELIYQSRKTEMKVERLADEMRTFQQEMRIFQQEMRAFKEEMRTYTKEMNKKWGELANSLGRLSEDIVAPGIPYAIKRCFGLDVTEISVRRRKKIEGKIREYDVIAVASDYVFVVDVKSTYRVKDFEIFEDTLKDLFDFFPEYSRYKVVPVVASMYLNEDVVEAATKRRWLALQLSGDYLDFVNKEVFSIKGD